MAHLYEVETNKGTKQVETDHHHDNLSAADFQRILLAAVANALGGLAQGLVLHRFTYKGRR